MILGFKFLKSFNYIIDYKTRKIEISSNELELGNTQDIV